MSWPPQTERPPSCRCDGEIAKIVAAKGRLDAVEAAGWLDAWGEDLRLMRPQTHRSGR